MLNRYTYIAPQHRVALESTIRNHSVVSSVNGALLAKMYKMALDGFEKTQKEEGFSVSSLRSENVWISSVTEITNGYWLQLAKVTGQETPYLTFGQKWIMEQPVPAHGNVATKLW